MFSFQVYPGNVLNTYHWRATSADEVVVWRGWYTAEGVDSEAVRRLAAQDRATTVEEDISLVERAAGPQVAGLQAGTAGSRPEQRREFRAFHPRPSAMDARRRGRMSYRKPDVWRDPSKKLFPHQVGFTCPPHDFDAAPSDFLRMSPPTVGVHGRMLHVPDYAHQLGQRKKNFGLLEEFVECMANNGADVCGQVGSSGCMPVGGVSRASAPSAKK